jgi:hypothetical protein
MARVDDFEQALELAKRELAGKNPDLLVGFSGTTIQRDEGGNPSLALRFLGRPISIPWPGLEILTEDNNGSLSIQQQILIFHYLLGAWRSSGIEITGDWIAYREVPDGRFYLDAFLKRAQRPLVQAFGEQPERMVELAKSRYEAGPFDQGDHAVIVHPLPLVPLALVLWRGDEEFPPEGNILFDRSISAILSAEDIAWLAGMVVYPLVGMSKGGKDPDPRERSEVVVNPDGTR